MRRSFPISLVLFACVLGAAEPARAGAADSTAVRAADSTRVASGDSSAAAASDTTELQEGAPRLLTGWEGADTLAADGEQEAVSDSTVRPPWIIPIWNLDYIANESEYKTGSGFNIVFNPGSDWRGNSILTLQKREYRGRDMSDIIMKFNNTAVKIVPLLYDVNFAVGQDYLRQKAVGLARSGGDMVIQNKFANAGFKWERPEIWTSRSQFAVTGKAGGGQNDFKYDNNFQGTASGYLWYGLGHDVNVRGGYGIWRRVEDSDVAGRVFENMHSDSDTIKAKIDYGTGAQKLLHLDYQRSVGVIRKVDPPRGNSLEVIENPDLAKMEKSSRKSEKITVRSRIQPLDPLTLDFEFKRDYFDQQNVVDERLSKETELKKLNGRAGYKYAASGRIDVELDRMENDVDYGPVSLSSYLEKESSVRVSLSQDITDSLRVTLRGNGSLKQRYYIKRDANPRDADYLNYFFQADLDARLPYDITAGVKFTYRQYETINIDASLSGDNRTDFTYWVVPRFQLRPTAWFEIGQEYEIKMEFTDFTFNENENYLDRTTVMSTKANFRILSSNLGIRHMYRFIDTGSYLRPPDGGERLYGRTNESFEHRLSFRYDFTPVNDFSIYSHSNYRFQESNRLGEVDGEKGVISTRLYNSGEMALGFRRTTRLTDSGKADLDIGWVKRFGPNLTKERREFWDVAINVVFNF
jgi:hypothetical protein